MSDVDTITHPSIGAHARARRKLPKSSPPQRGAVSKKIRILMKEGKSQEQAVAMALQMQRDGRLGRDGSYKRDRNERKRARKG